jgi:hypothetical protein
MLQVMAAYFLFLFAQLYPFSFCDVNGREFISFWNIMPGRMHARLELFNTCDMEKDTNRNLSHKYESLMTPLYCSMPMQCKILS